ncbi:hypothetical protein PSYJA_27184 [Pseudomonas syringae pv. japonica str. M301072]|uniref:Uncharacterized protein n=1 Tax=Pseudomonas syringae pv. japonica str. M301072 TaxID=629262 RepID=F3FQF3_PSESX|nr:hypothetical protein PSYJA_27184 [Pseudomonas syringae pv. japonica str. M301072]
MGLSVIGIWMTVVDCQNHYRIIQWAETSKQ